MKIIIQKNARQLWLLGDEGTPIFSCPLALGFCPVGPKEREGDGRTPVGQYFVCLKKLGKYGPSLGISYPSPEDARRMNAPEALIACIEERAAKGQRPPWGSPLGGEIYIHGGGAERDWTAGCIALSDENARRLYDQTPLGTRVEIREG